MHFQRKNTFQILFPVKNWYIFPISKLWKRYLYSAVIYDSWLRAIASFPCKIVATLELYNSRFFYTILDILIQFSILWYWLGKENKFCFRTNILAYLLHHSLLSPLFTFVACNFVFVAVVNCQQKITKRSCFMSHRFFSLWQHVSMCAGNKSRRALNDTNSAVSESGKWQFMDCVDYSVLWYSVFAYFFLH